MTREIDEISRMLGRFEESLSVLKAASELGMAQRAEMILRLGNLEGVSARMTSVERRQDGSERAINTLEKWRQQGIGVSKFIALVSGVVGAALAVAVQYVLGTHK